MIAVNGGVFMVIDEQIVSRASAGDRNAFTILYNSVYKDMYKFALYTLGNQDEAFDAVSDTFLDIWKGIGKLKDPGSFPAWSMRILSIKCKKHISDIIDSKNKYNLDDLIETPSDSESSIDESVSEGSSLAAALGTLDADDRMIITLSVLHGYRNKEISEMLGIPAGTVSSRLYRAYEKLRNILGGEN